MTTTTLLLTGTAARTTVPVAPGATHATGSRPPTQRGVPLTMPRSQEYYWRSGWQKAERASLADLAAGRRFHFDSGDPEDAARWLDEWVDPDSS